MVGAGRITGPDEYLFTQLFINPVNRFIMKWICIFLIVITPGLRLYTQNCTAMNSTQFIDCVNNAVTRPATITISNPSSSANLNINAANLDLSNLTILVDKKVNLNLSGTITINSNTTFTNQNGNSVIFYGGDSFAGSSGSNELNNLISTCGCTTLEQALPVELTHFAARTKDDMVELDWTTATELNNDFFQIEHSRDGIQFQPVGKVKGEGTTTEIINYNFMHRQPVSGTNYYRLKQVDYDGAFEYSDIVVVEVSSRAGGVQIYPNPTIDKAVIQMNERPERVTFTLTTLLGQRLDLQPGQSDAGWELDLSDLPKGVYILQMEYDGQHLSRKIVRE